MHARCLIHWLSCSFLLACGSSSGPQPGDIGVRVGHSMTYDATAHRVLEFGGSGVEGGASGLRASLWSWDGVRWTRIDAGTGGPAARVDAAFVYDAVSQRPLLLGGRLGRAPDATALKDVWEWTGTEWAGRADSLPVARAHAAIAFDATRQRVVLYGGVDPVTGQEAADLWELARAPGAVWTATAVTGPANAFAPVLVFDQVAGHCWLLVSRVADRRVLLFSWNGTTLARIDTTGPNLTGYAVAPRGSVGGFVLFGGSNGSALVATTWIWDGSQWSLAAAPGPAARTGHAMTFDPSRDRVVMFGGESNGGGSLGDTWEFDGAVWRAAP